MDKIITKKGEIYEVSTIENLDFDAMRSTRSVLIQEIKDFAVRLQVKKDTLAKFNIALGLKADDETE